MLSSELAKMYEEGGKTKRDGKEVAIAILLLIGNEGREKVPLIANNMQLSLQSVFYDLRVNLFKSLPSVDEILPNVAEI